MANNYKHSIKKEQQKWIFSIILLFFIVLITIIILNISNQKSDGVSENNDTNINDIQIITENESLIIPVNDISETAKFYTVKVDGIIMEVVAVKAPDGTIRTAFNTCQVCNGSPKAYFSQKASSLECQNCGNKFPMNRVGVEAGGCNPVPIMDKDKIATDESIIISYNTLKVTEDLFKTWKQK